MISATAKRLGTIVLPRHPHNFAWGGEDGTILSARSALYRMQLSVPGIRP